MSNRPHEDGTILPPWKLNRAIELLSENLAQPISVDELARTVGLSPSHFSRAFTASTGVSPYEWLSRRRVEQAKQLLETTTSPITAIALELGYCSPNHFASRFRQFTGMCPRDWRRIRPAST
ncbi:helix-turn-helix domain-containing protein [Bradyrhizobium sp. TM239]|uniref:helix-turn-helix domain-containing protein n=1 Tax=Bradyrhizobium sp. TM239 TaxID=2599802 RepID=UPI00403D6B38